MSVASASPSPFVPRKLLIPPTPKRRRTGPARGPGLIGEILLVEDTATDADLARRALRRGRVANPLTVVTSGEAALDYLLGTGSRADIGPTKPLLVLLDLNLPTMSGSEFRLRVRQHGQLWQTPIALLTQSKSASKIAGCLRTEMDDYLVKPIDVASLNRVVRRLKLHLTRLPVAVLPPGRKLRAAKAPRRA